MDFCYYDSQLKEELDGACDYIERAIVCKADHPEWAAIYAKNSTEELAHASTIVKIFEDDWKKSKTSDPIYDQIHDSLLKKYAEGTAKVKQMHTVYNSK